MKSSKIFRILLWKGKEKNTLKAVAGKTKRFSLCAVAKRKRKKVSLPSAITVLLPLGVHPK